MLVDGPDHSVTKTFSNSNLLKFLDAQIISDFIRYFRNSKDARLKVFFKSVLFSAGVLIIFLSPQFPKFSYISVIPVILIIIVIIFPIFLLIFAIIEFNGIIFKVESSSLLAVSELMAVLQTSRNLEIGISFLKESQYPVISEICQETLSSSSVSELTTFEIFRKNIETKGIGKMRETFLELLDNWEIAPEIVDNFREKLVTRYTSFLDKGNKQIELLATIYSAAGTLLPLVTIALLLISGNFTVATSIMIIVFLLLVYFGIPISAAFNSSSTLTFNVYEYPVSPAVFSAYMGTNFLKGITYEEGLLGLTGRVKSQNTRKKEVLDNIVFSLTMGWELSDYEQQQLGEILSGKTGGYLIRLIRKFKDLDSKVAGEILMVLSKVLHEEEKHLTERITFLSSERRKMILLSIISSISLGLLTACAPMFLLVVNFIQNGKTALDGSSSLKTAIGIETVFIFIINIVVALYPARLKIDQNERILNIGDITTALVIIITYCIAFFVSRIYIINYL